MDVLYSQKVQMFAMAFATLLFLSLCIPIALYVMIILNDMKPEPGPTDYFLLVKEHAITAAFGLCALGEIICLGFYIIVVKRCRRSYATILRKRVYPVITLQLFSIGVVCVGAFLPGLDARQTTYMIALTAYFWSMVVSMMDTIEMTRLREEVPGHFDRVRGEVVFRQADDGFGRFLDLRILIFLLFTETDEIETGYLAELPVPIKEHNMRQHL